MRVTIIGIILAILVSQTVYASDGQIQEGAVIPDYMQPGSVIQYLDNEQYEILKGGEPTGEKYRNREELELEEPIMGFEEYPPPETGMLVYYAEDGQVNKITFATKEAEVRWLTSSPDNAILLKIKVVIEMTAKNRYNN